MLAYLRIGALVAFMGVVAVALYYRAEAASAAAEAAQAQANLAVSKSVIAAQEETIGRQQATAEQNAKDTAALIDELEAIHKATAEMSDAIGQLEKSNATVAAYLGAAVPDDLRLLLNGQGDGPGKAGGHP